MPRYSEDVSTSGDVRGANGVFSNGLHAESKFDSNTGLRRAESSEHEIHLTFRINSGVTVANVGVPLWTANEVAEVVSMDVTPEVAPTGGDLDYDVQLQKGNAGSAFATILSADVTVNSSSANRTPQAASIDSTKKDLADGDSLKLTVTTGGSTGTQGTGLVVTIIVRSRPQP